jgi:hypothetical protein
MESPPKVVCGNLVIRPLYCCFYGFLLLAVAPRFSWPDWPVSMLQKSSEHRGAKNSAKCRLLLMHSQQSSFCPSSSISLQVDACPVQSDPSIRLGSTYMRHTYRKLVFELPINECLGAISIQCSLHFCGHQRYLN